MNNNHAIQFHLKEIMNEKQISKNKLCKMTGLRFETIQGYYLGTISRIDLYVLSLLCEALHCNVEKIITYQKDVVINK